MSDFWDSHNFGGRTEYFKFLAGLLAVQERPVIIVETGSMRPSDHPVQDGQATLVWDWIVSQMGGKCFTIDISPENSAHTKSRVSDSTEVITMDSLKFLSSIAIPEIPFIDLLYLDSLDWDDSDQDKMESALHHAGELAAAWHHIAPGGIIAVDDCWGEYQGKQALIECFFNLLQVPPIFTGSIYAWRKPVRAV